MTNLTRHSIGKNTVLASAGLMLYGVAAYLMIRSGIGISPWDALNQGVAQLLHIQYGDASIMLSLLVLLVDILMHEKIGIGMFLDSFLVGKTVDLLDYLNLLPMQTSLAAGIPMLLLGMVIAGFAQAIYMNAGLGCGPRDSFLVGLSRRMPRVPIGLISVCIFVVVSLLAFFLKGPIGIGTVLCVLFQGTIMQVDFNIMKFDPKVVDQQDLFTSFKVLVKKQA